MANKSFEEFKVADYLKEEILNTKDPYLKSSNGFSVSILYNSREVDKMLYTAILEECKHNIWFFFREIARVPSLYSDIGEQFTLTSISYAMIKAYECKCNFIVSSIFENSQIHQTLILLALYEYICNYPSKTYNYINTFLTKACLDETEKLIVSNKIGEDISQYANVLNYALPFFINFNSQYVKVLKNEFNSSNTQYNRAIARITVDTKIREILDRNLYVFNFESLSEEMRFFLLECCNKYHLNNHDGAKIYSGRFMFELDFNNIDINSLTVSYIQFMIPRIKSTDFMVNPKHVDYIMRESCDNGSIIHIAETIDDNQTNNYKLYKTNEYLKKIKM